MSRPGKTSSRCFENAGSIDIRSSNCPWIGHSLTITILPSFSMMLALISPTFSFRRISTGILPSKICWRISGIHFGHSESVSRGQPSFGFCFSQLLRRGLSDHFGTKPGFRLMELIRSKTCQAALAATAITFSTCLIGLVNVDAPRVIKRSVNRSYSIVRGFEWDLHERTEMLSPALDGALGLVNGIRFKSLIISHIRTLL